MEESTTLKDEVKKLNENFETLVSKKEAKKFRLPFRAKVGKRKSKEGYASIAYINENRGVNFMKVPIKEGAIMVNGAPHLATTDYMLTYKNKPFMIVPSWNTEPFAPGEDLDKATREKKTTYGFRLLLNILKSEVIKPKRAVSTGAVILILVALAVGAYFLFGGSF